MEQVEFKGSIPEAYETYFRSVLFDPFAKWQAARLPMMPGVRLLEIAAGTGALTREILKVLPSDGALTATDIQNTMIGVARRVVPPDPRVTFDVADALDLPFEDGSFDVIVCQFGYMFFPDKHRAMREVRRVLSLGGTHCMLVWYPVDLNPIAQVAREVITSFFEDRPPRAFEIPHGFSNREELETVMKAAGFENALFEDVQLTGHATAAGAAAAYCQGTPMGMELTERLPGRVPEVEAALAAAYLERFGAEEFDHEMNARYVSCTR